MTPVPSIYSDRLVNVELSAGLIDDGRHDYPHPDRPSPHAQNPPRPGATLRRAQGTPAAGAYNDGCNPVGPGGRRGKARHTSHSGACGAPRIHGELVKLGIEVAERTVSRLLPKRHTSPSQTWRTFLANHVRDLVPIDFFTVPTACFRVLFALVFLAHQRRRVLLFNVTERPTAPWTAQQIVDAFPDDSAPSYLLRDRDTVYGERSVRMRRLISSPSSVRIAIWLRGRPPEARCRDSPPTPTSRAGIRREVAGTSSRTRPGSAMWSSS